MVECWYHGGESNGEQQSTKEVNEGHNHYIIFESLSKESCRLGTSFNKSIATIIQQ